MSFYEAFFQKNSSYYIDKLEKHQSGQKFTFNIYAFLFGFMWFLYRKMYLETICILALLVVEGFIESYLIETYFPGNNGMVLSWALTLVVWTFTGFVANHIYIRKAERVVMTAINKETDMESANGYIKRKGGTSYFFLIALIILAIVFFVHNNFMTDEYDG